MKKILFGFLFFILIISNTKALKIVSLGDSISSGYLLSDQKYSFDNLLASTLNADLFEYSYLGMRSDDLLIDLNNESIKKEIENANIIIINIGANDLLDLLDYADLSKVGIEIEYGSIPKIEFNSEFIKNLKTYLRDFTVNELEPMAIEAANDFSTIFPLIIEKVKDYNSEAKILVNSLYNPFFDISVPLFNLDLHDIENIADNTIKRFNNTIYNHDGYEIIDVYNVLRNNNYLNVNPFKLSFDPHPNLEGHKKIYELYLKELCYKVNYDDKSYYILKGEKINITPNKRFGYTFIKWNHNLNSIDSDIELKAIYRFNYLYIILPSLIIVSILVIIKEKKH